MNLEKAIADLGCMTRTNERGNAIETEYTHRRGLKKAVANLTAKGWKITSDGEVTELACGDCKIYVFVYRVTNVVGLMAS